MIIGASEANPAGGNWVGETYIIYGYSGMESVTGIDLDGTPANVTRIYCDDSGDFSGISVSNGDINGDGYSDVIIGAYLATPASGSWAGETYIIYGSTGMESVTGIDLNGTPSNVTRIYGDDANDNSGGSVSSGDFNGDGFFDVIIGARSADPASGSGAGETYVIYGGIDVDPPSAPKNLTAVAYDDSVRFGWDANTESDLRYYVLYRDTTGSPTDSIATIYKPDITYMDINVQIETAYYYRLSAVDSSGNKSDYSNEVSVITYTPPTSDFSPGTQQVGTVPLGVNFIDNSANSPTSWLWHFGDGTTSTAQSPSHSYKQTGIYTVSLRASNAGRSDMEVKQALVWAKAERVINLPASVDLNVTPGNENAKTTRIYGDNANDHSGYSVSSGDINGDGYTGVIIGAREADPTGGSFAGETYIIYGYSGMESVTGIDLDGTPANVTRIYGDDASDYSGYSVSSGDINGDGYTDVIIGAYQADPAGGSDAGETYIIYGYSGMASVTSIDLDGTPANVTRIYGDDSRDYSGLSVSSGDINGDGFADVIIGAYQADPAGGSAAGETYIIYGSSGMGSVTGIDLDGTPANVTRIYGDDYGDVSG